MTQQEVAEALGVRREAISLMEKKIMMKIRAEFERRGIKKEDYLGDMT
jgi:DNA-binding XRE family transcriptional regulator